MTAPQVPFRIANQCKEGPSSKETDGLRFRFPLFALLAGGSCSRSLLALFQDTFSLSCFSGCSRFGSSSSHGGSSRGSFRSTFVARGSLPRQHCIECRTEVRFVVLRLVVPAIFHGLLLLSLMLLRMLLWGLWQLLPPRRGVCPAGACRSSSCSSSRGLLSRASSSSGTPCTTCLVSSIPRAARCSSSSSSSSAPGGPCTSASTSSCACASTQSREVVVAAETEGWEVVALRGTWPGLCSHPALQFLSQGGPCVPVTFLGCSCNCFSTIVPLPTRQWYEVFRCGDLLDHHCGWMRPVVCSIVPFLLFRSPLLRHIVLSPAFGLIPLALITDFLKLVSEVFLRLPAEDTAHVDLGKVDCGSNRQMRQEPVSFPSFLGDCDFLHSLGSHLWQVVRKATPLTTKLM
mmetsp:Transcript_33014/g.71111  ORF Transcript_33014/g.71111 Transcript_33014/m.71111 type:complete len:403 (-) Transcript_33014:1119-2327(-)